MEIRAANSAEIEAITDLGIRSKASWGYTDDRMRVFREELTWTDELLASRAVYVAVDPKVVGYFSLNQVDAQTVDLEHLFVEPAAFGNGIGTILFKHACQVAREKGYERLTLMSDPNAAGFYDKLECRKIADIPSSIPGRTIPTYEFTLTA